MNRNNSRGEVSTAVKEESADQTDRKHDNGGFRQNRGGFNGPRGGAARGGSFRKDSRPNTVSQNKPPEATTEAKEDPKVNAEENEEYKPDKVQEKKFTGRCRLFVGNIPGDMNDEEFQKLFEPFGEFTEAFLNAGRGFGFVRMDTRHNAENARAALDGQVVRGGRNLRVRLAGHGAALRVKYLTQHISNEVLEHTFSMFGEVERAIVVVDDKGRPTGDGIVEFARKPAAMSALKRISEGVFLMSSQPRPIMVEPLEQNDESDGLPEIFFQKTQDLLKDREQPPRFAQMGSFEFEFGQKWKKLYQMQKEQEEMLKRNFEEEVAKLEMDQETAQLEQHAIMLRQDLQRRQEELRQLEEQTQLEIQRRMEMRRMEEDRKRGGMEAEIMRRRQQQEEMRRQMEVKNHQGHSAEQAYAMERERQMIRGSEHGGIAPTLQPPPVPPGIDRVRMRAQGARYEQHVQQGAGNVGAMGNMGVPGNMVPGANMGHPENAGMGRDEHFDVKRQRRF